MAVLQSKLILSLIDKVSGPSRALNTALARNNEALEKMRGKMLESVGVGYALARSISAPIKAAVAFESTMADIAKVVDFDSPKAFAQMGADIRQMSLRIPIAADGLGQIVAAAGQSGIANSELLKFTELAAKVGVAWDVSAGEAGESMAKLKTALGRSVEDTASLADAINYLGNKSAASAPQILDVVKRVAPMASQFGMTAEQVAALGAAMTGAGFESEVASTSILNIGRALTKGSSATKRQEQAYKQLGLSSKNVAKSMQKDSMGTLQNVLSRVAKLPAAVRASVVSDLFGDEARAIGPLISNGKLLGDTLAYVSDKTKYAGSAQAEFETRSKTTANSMQLFGNRVTDLSVSVGNALLPALNLVLDKLGPMVTSISDLAQRYPQVTAAITIATAALIAFKVALTAAQFAGLFMKGSLLTVGSGFLSFGSTILGVINPLNLVKNALGVLRIALIGTGIGALLIAVAAAGTFIYNNWSGISIMFAQFGRAFMEAIKPAMPALQPLIDGAKLLWNKVNDLLGPIDGLGESWFRMGQDAGKAVGDAVVALTQLPSKVVDIYNQIVATIASNSQAFFNAGSAMVQGLWDGMTSKFDAFIAWVREIPSRIVAAIGRIDLSGIVSWPSLPSWAGGSSAPAAPAVDGARASGGPVSGGKSYLVGERGPELFSPSNSGLITPNHVLPSGGGGSTTVSVNVSMSNSFASPSDPNAVMHMSAQLARATKHAVESSYAGADGI